MSEKCGKHPTYKAIRKPTADCDVCRLIYHNASHARLVAAARTAYADIEILEGKLRDLGSGPANTRSIVRELEEIKSDLHTALAEVEGA